VRALLAAAPFWST